MLARTSPVSSLAPSMSQYRELASRRTDCLTAGAYHSISAIWLEPRELPVAVLLTKADKLSRGAALALERAVARELGPGVKLARFSALTGEGVAQAQAWIEEWLTGTP